MSRAKKKSSCDDRVDVVTMLRGARLKVTRTRLEIARHLATAEAPLAVAELQEVDPVRGCNLTTIYRNLLALESAGLVARERAVIGPTRFAWKHSKSRPGSHDHHLECRVCRKKFLLPACGLSETERSLERSGFRDITHSLEFRGVCQGCWDSPSH